MNNTLDGFNQREKAFEAKFLHDEELNFRITAKRNHLFGQWASNLLGYKDEKAERYIVEVIVADCQKTHEDDVLHKVLRDLKAAKVKISEHRARKTLIKCWKEAHKIIMNEKEH
ncbi:MAG TPA: DUF1476 domain-containing protein [Alphaproteobacteria bacterium]|nr:DUF1476 domain-containing protein [Alphaproteobacteria bacterium]